MNTLPRLADEIAEIIEPNLQFYRNDPNDRNRYFVGPEVLQAVAWVSTAIAVPLLLSGVSEVIKIYVERWLKKSLLEKAASAEAALPSDISFEAERLLTGGGAVEIDDERLQEAVNAVAEFLGRRGWPKAFATADAESIVHSISKRLKSPT